MTGTTANTAPGDAADLERIFHAWDDALGAKDVDAALALYAEDATLESPLVRHLLGGPHGIVRGREQLRRFLPRVFAHQSPKRQRSRTGYLTDGTRLSREYPRTGVEGDSDQMDIVEVLQIRDGLIEQHHVYWGWYSFSLLDDDRRVTDPVGEAGRANLDQAQAVYHQWHERARTGDVAGLLELDTDDATLESPLVTRVLDRADGTLHGKTELGRFFHEGARRRPNDLVRWHREDPFLWNGHTLSWEYRRVTPDGDQIDIAEVMELADGRITDHRVYWGWYGTEHLITNATRQS